MSSIKSEVRKGEGAGAGEAEEKAKAIADFLEYKIIRSESADKQFEGDGARGDGLCAMWAMLIGWSLLQARKNLVKDPRFLINDKQPETMQDLIDLVIKVGNGLISETLKFLHN